MTPTWISPLRELFWPSPPAPGSDGADADGILPPERRKKAMTSLDPKEVKLAFAAFMLSLVAGVVIPAYITAANKVTRRGKNTYAVAPDAWLLGGALIVLSLVGLVVLWRRRRTLVSFALFFIGFGFTLFIGLAGFVFILLGGWLMLRAWRINRYGTTNAKVIARETSARRGRDRGTTTKTRSKTSAGSTPAPARRRRPASATRPNHRPGSGSPSPPSNPECLRRRAPPAARHAAAGARRPGVAPTSGRSAPPPGRGAPRPR